MSIDLFFPNGTPLPDQRSIPRQWEFAPSVWWPEYRSRPASVAEVYELASGLHPSILRADRRSAFSDPGVREDIVAARVGLFLKLHPELSDRAKLDLVRLFPFAPECFDGAGDLCAGDADFNKPDAPSLGCPFEGEKPESWQGHDKFSVVGFDNPTVKSPAGERKPAGGGASRPLIATRAAAA